MSYLITASLMGSIDWLSKCPPDYKESAYNQLHDQLARIYPKELPIAMKRGIEFEKMVQKVVESKMIDTTNASPAFKAVCRLCDGGKFQQVTKSNISINGMDICLYGKIDVFMPNHIIDIKTTKSFKKASYTNSVQHLIYCYNEQIKEFTYIVAEFEDAESNNIKQVHTVPLIFDDLTIVKEKLFMEVEKALDFLQLDESLWKIYTTKFSKYN